jgi:hypothetical protein
LELASSALLRFDSYVNLRHVYKIDWTCLRPYSNPDTPWNTDYRFERESVIRMLAKGRVLTTYEAASQLQTPSHESSIQCIDTQSPSQDSQALLFPESDASSIASSEGDNQPTLLQSDFLALARERDGSYQRPPRAPPDGEDACCAWRVIWLTIIDLVKCLSLSISRLLTWLRRRV